jgi:hypothetical protein
MKYRLLSLSDFYRTKRALANSLAQLKYLPSIGILLPIPNALGDTLSIGAIWWRFHSFIFTMRSTLFIKA